MCGGKILLRDYVNYCNYLHKLDGDNIIYAPSVKIFSTIPRNLKETILMVLLSFWVCFKGNGMFYPFPRLCVSSSAFCWPFGGCCWPFGGVAGRVFPSLVLSASLDLLVSNSKDVYDTFLPDFYPSPNTNLLAKLLSYCVSTCRS